jgi:hypothetical protein
MKRVDVFLETGVCVYVGDDVDPATDAGYAEVKRLAAGEFARAVTSLDFDVTIEGEETE